MGSVDDAVDALDVQSELNALPSMGKFTEMRAFISHTRGSPRCGRDARSLVPPKSGITRRGHD